ncbi:MAG: hypothetical protein U0U70_01750 [Chitinophagaceae bacterium]
MEGIKKENNNENKSTTLPLDQDRVTSAAWGESLEEITGELIKVLSILNHLQEKNLRTKEDFDKIAVDLFSEFNVSIFDYDDIFTPSLVNKFLHVQEINGISFMMNNTPIVIKRGDTVESIVSEWREKTIDSPKALQEREETLKKEAELIKAKQISLDTLFAGLDSIDFNNPGLLMDWLYQYNSHIIHGSNMHEKSLLEKFQSHGYGIEKNDGIEYMLGEALQDRERTGKVIIAYMLQNLGLFFRSGVKQAIEKWKKQANS